MAIQRIPKPTGKRFVTHQLNAIHVLKNNWAGMIIHISNNSASENCPEAIGYLNNFLLNFEFYYDACEDILHTLSLTSVSIQGEDGKSICEAATLVKKLMLKLSLLTTGKGIAEEKASTLYSECSDNTSNNST